MFGMTLSGLLLVPLLATAAPSELVVATGNCKDPDLIGAVRELDRTLAAPGAKKVSAITPEQAAAKLEPSPTLSVDEIHRLLDSAQNAYYSNEYEKATQLLGSAMPQIDRMAPSRVAFDLRTSANLIQAAVLRRTGHASESDDAYLRVLKVSPRYRLDPNYYSPSTRAHFEQLRKKLERSPKHRLVIRSTPAGADVHLDGQSMGKTPLTLQLASGNYQLWLTRGDTRGFPRQIDLTADQTVVVDLGFEGAVNFSHVPCISTVGNEAARLALTTKLGSALGVDQAVALRIERDPQGPSWLSATLVNVSAGGQKIRQGSLKVRDFNPPISGLPDLVKFLETGEVAGTVVQHLPSSIEKPTVVSASDTSVTEALSPSPPGHWKKPLGIGLGAGGVVAALLGAYFEISAGSKWSDYDSYYANGGAPTSDQAPQVAALRDSAKSKQTLGTVGLITGGVLLAAGAYFYFTAPSSHASKSGVAARVSFTGTGGAFTLTW